MSGDQPRTEQGQPATDAVDEAFGQWLGGSYGRAAADPKRRVRLETRLREAFRAGAASAAPPAMRPGVAIKALLRDHPAGLSSGEIVAALARVVRTRSKDRGGLIRVTLFAMVRSGLLVRTGATRREFRYRLPDAG